MSVCKQSRTNSNPQVLDTQGEILRENGSTYNLPTLPAECLHEAYVCPPVDFDPANGWRPLEPIKTPRIRNVVAFPLRPAIDGANLRMMQSR